MIVVWDKYSQFDPTAVIQTWAAIAAVEEAPDPARNIFRSTQSGSGGDVFRSTQGGSGNLFR